MKTIDYLKVIEDIDQRLKKFDESRITNKKSDIHQFSINTNIDKIVDKKIDIIENHIEELFVGEIIDELVINNYANSSQEIKNPKEVEVAATLSIVTDDFIAKDFFEIEKSMIDEKKLANFRKNDNYFLENELEIEDVPKKETTSFFKSISDFFNDSKKESKPNIKAAKETRQTIEQETASLHIEPSEELQTNEIPVEKSQEEIDDEKAIKAEKLRIIEEEYRLKAEKREIDEKLLTDKIAAEQKKSAADFRKNKRKK